MTPQNVDERLWEIQYSAEVSQEYYSEFVRKWEKRSRTGKLVGIAFSVGGVIVGAYATTYPQLGVVAAAAGLISTGLGLFFLIVPIGKFLAESLDRYEEFTKVLGQCKKLHLRLESSKDDEVDDVTLFQLERLIEDSNEIARRYPISDKQLHIQCQRDVNKRTYAVTDGTYEEVMQKLGQSSDDSHAVRDNDETNDG